jgi:antirestriction protein
MKQNQENKAITPRIYVASLADYKAGRLLGRWIDADQTAEAIHAQIAEMLAESKEPVAQAWAIHDYEGFGSLKLEESDDIEFVADVAQMMGEYGTLYAEVVAYFHGAAGAEEARKYMEQGYCGEFDKLEDYAQQVVEDCYSDAIEKLPDFIKHHIDYAGIAGDMKLNRDVFTIEHSGRVHVFNLNL